MKRTTIVWVLYFGLILLSFFLSSCSHTVINGIKVKERKNSKPDEATVFYMTVSFWLSYGISSHFIHKK